MPLLKPAVAACAVGLALSCAPAIAVEIAPTVPWAATLEGSHARIGAIFIEVGDIFDTTKPGENKRLYRFANRVHIDVVFPLDGDSSLQSTQFLLQTKRSFQSRTRP
jgi:hypothetical protein